MEQEQIIEGPYWDYIAVSDYADDRRNMWARLAAQALLDGDSSRAALFAARFAAFQSLRDRIRDRYESTEGDRVLTFIGWRSSSDRRY